MILYPFAQIATLDIAPFPDGTKVFKANRYIAEQSPCWWGNHLSEGILELRGSSELHRAYLRPIDRQGVHL